MCSKCVFVLIGIAAFRPPMAAAMELPYLDVEVLDTTAPPGGTAQLVVQLTEPKPITSGEVRFSLGRRIVSLAGIYLFSDTGDVRGAATFLEGELRVRFVSPSGTYGMSTAYAPIMVISLVVDPAATLGETIPAVLDESSSYWNDPAGHPWPQVVRQGKVTVAGTVTISDVRPAGDVVAGREVDVLGFGFQPGAAVLVDGVPADTVKVDSSTHIDIRFAADTSLEEHRVQVVNPDQSSASYIAYERFRYRRSAVPLLAATVPVFADEQLTEATVGPLTAGDVGAANRLVGIAVGNPIDNPSDDAAEVHIRAYSPTMDVLETATVQVRRGEAFLKDISELLHISGQSGIYLRLASEIPVRMLVLAGDEATGELVPAR